MSEQMSDMLITASLGGSLIGLSAIVLMLFLGRIAGISGSFANVITAKQHLFNHWQSYFILGLVIGSYLVVALIGIDFQPRQNFSVPLLIISGLLVGYGTQLGSGCTSGHGICGISRLSIRSVIAVITFMLVAIITVAVTK